MECPNCRKVMCISYSDGESILYKCKSKECGFVVLVDVKTMEVKQTWGRNSTGKRHGKRS